MNCNFMNIIFIEFRFVDRPIMKNWKAILEMAATRIINKNDYVQIQSRQQYVDIYLLETKTTMF